VTLYRFPSLSWTVVWRELQRTQYYPFVLRNSKEGEVFQIEGDSAGFVQLAVHFLMVAAEGFYSHLETRDRVRGAWMFEAGVPVKIGDNTGKGWEARMISSYTYKSRPLHGQNRPSLGSGAECIAALHDDFSISGNFEALLSLANHSFDLADPETGIGAGCDYEPGAALSSDSIPLHLRRIANA